MSRLLNAQKTAPVITAYTLTVIAHSFKNIDVQYKGSQIQIAYRMITRNRQRKDFEITSAIWISPQWASTLASKLAGQRPMDRNSVLRALMTNEPKIKYNM